LIHLDNCPEFLLSWFACAEIGAVAVCTNTRSSPDELAYYAEHSNVVGAITQPRLAPMVDTALPTGGWIAVTDTDAGEMAASAIGASHRFELFLGAASLPTVPISSSAPASIQYTSGTTGRPKAVVWTHANVLWGAKVNAAHETLQPSDIHLVYLPLFHTNAQSYSILATLWAGATAVLQPRFSASRFWPVALRNRCTWASQIFFALRVLAQHDAPSEHWFRLWGTGMCGHPVEELFRVNTIGWWGMTETVSHPIVGDVDKPNRPRSMGRPANEYEVTVRRDDGTPVEHEETGHLFVRGRRGVSLFAEYLNDPVATAAAFDEDGWFRTGDLVTPHRDGFITFADRAKDMLKVGAENVAASEIERVVAGVPGVTEVAVVGAPDELLDEIPVAFVIADHERPTLIEDIHAACDQQLADFKRPRSVRLVSQLPRSTLEKVAKHELKRLLIQESDGPADR
jgi:crotonobetaine/carnitine-CoA ligase